MTTKEYQQLILLGLEGLPLETLAQITDYVYFMRQRMLPAERVEGAVYQAILAAELSQLNQHELTHLEVEFAGYAEQYPHE